MSETLIDESATQLSDESTVESKASLAVQFAAGTWRGDLWANVPTAIGWANQSPVSQPGTIIFNIRDNGQVWTYTFL